MAEDWRYGLAGGVPKEMAALYSGGLFGATGKGAEQLLSTTVTKLSKQQAAVQLQQLIARYSDAIFGKVLSPDSQRVRNLAADTVNRIYPKTISNRAISSAGLLKQAVDTANKTVPASAEIRVLRRTLNTLNPISAGAVQPPGLMPEKIRGIGASLMRQGKYRLLVPIGNLVKKIWGDKAGAGFKDAMQEGTQELVDRARTTIESADLGRKGVVAKLTKELDEAAAIPSVNKESIDQIRARLKARAAEVLPEVPAGQLESAAAGRYEARKAARQMRLVSAQERGTAAAGIKNVRTALQSLLAKEDIPIGAKEQVQTLKVVRSLQARLAQGIRASTAKAPFNLSEFIENAKSQLPKGAAAKLTMALKDMPVAAAPATGLGGLYESARGWISKNVGLNLPKGGGITGKGGLMKGGFGLIGQLMLFQILQQVMQSGFQAAQVGIQEPAQRVQLRAQMATQRAGGGSLADMVAQQQYAQAAGGAQQAEQTERQARLQALMGGLTEQQLSPGGVSFRGM